MKKIFLFLAVASTSIFVSCSDSNDGPTTDPNAATSIVLAANVTAIEVGQSVTFTVTDNNALVVTAASTITANDVAITGDTFTPTVAGSYTIKATHSNTNNVVLESNMLTIVVVEVPVANDSFVLNNVNYVTPDALFQYIGIFQLAPDTYVIGWGFNPFEEVVVDGAPTYPTDLYIYTIYPITPSGTDATTGNPTFTIAPPTAGTFTFSATPAALNVFDTQIFTGGAAFLPTVAADRLALISGVNLNITALDLTSTVTNLAATYTITLTDGVVVQGEYSGETGVYGLPQAKGAKITEISSTSQSFQNFLNAYKKSNVKR